MDADPDKTAQKEIVKTVVTFRDLPDEELKAYLNIEEPYDCAGSAKNEALGIAILEKIESSDPTALTGLPLIALTTMLRQCGLSFFSGAAFEAACPSESDIFRAFLLDYHRICKLKVEESQRGKAVAERFLDVDKVVEDLELAVLLYAADAQFVVQRFIKPHFAMRSGDIVVYPRVEIFHVFCGPSAYDVAFVVFAPADSYSCGYCAVFGRSCAVASHNDFQAGPVFQ